ncbi:MAG: DNA repair protein RecN [Calditrichaeota bacterium]|nr:MAG: DNA repair protein RecN [Calditrichota bacterium]
MLKYLHIRHFALAEDLSVEFEKGLNILTGETGAGKSILVGALNAVVGGRVYAEVVRTGFPRATVEAVFDLNRLPELKRWLEEKGLACGDELLIRREISQKGGTRAFVNDSVVSISLLAELGDRLVDIHGQHEHQSLLRSETHRYYLDALGRLEGELENLASLYRQTREAEKALADLTRRQRELEEKYELYQFQLNEIESAGLQPGEEASLQEERRRLVNFEKLFELTARLEQYFAGEEVNLLALLAAAGKDLQELARYATELAPLAGEFESARIIAEETHRAVTEFQNQLEFDPRRLEQIEARLSQIQLLKKKYGATVEEVLGYLETLRQKLHLRENFDLELARLRKSFDALRSRFSEQVLALSEARRSAARQLEEAVMAELARLGMPRTRFKVQLDWKEDPEGLFVYQGKTYAADAQGADVVEFFISPNPGEDFKPLNKIASGGEISRIMLALKRILARVDRVPTLVFDEIDIGVSGRIAQAVGRSIAELAGSHQVICITHLPQIAACGRHHFVVSKSVSDGRTYTRVTRLSREEQVEEIARLMSGEQVTEPALASARRLIEESRLQTVPGESDQ